MIRTLLALAGIVFANHAPAQDSVEWSELRAARPESCSAFLSRLEDNSDCNYQTFMARMAAKKVAACTPGNPDFDGIQVRIAGYAHPLEMEFRGVQDFLLTPPLRSDCRHPSPPVPDQVIRVRSATGIDISFDPVWVTGTLTLTWTDDMNAPASYRLEATAVTPATLVDVNGE